MTKPLRALALAGAGLLAAGAAFAQPAPGAGQAPRGERIFEMLDLNRDGRITFEEAWAVVTQRFAAADVDRSGGLSPAEFATLRARPADAPPLPPERAARREERQAAMFRGLDANRDGQLTLEEFRPVAEMRFRAGDANGDGAVTREEVRRTGHGRGDGLGRGPGTGPGAPATPGR